MKPWRKHCYADKLINTFLWPCLGATAARTSCVRERLLAFNRVTREKESSLVKIGWRC